MISICVQAVDNRATSEPVVQLAVSYVVCDVTDGVARLVRRLRIVTLQTSQAPTAEHYLQSADAPTTLALVLHKACNTWTRAISVRYQ